MKKAIVLLFLILSIKANANDYSYFCSTKAPSKTFFGAISSVSGLNLLSRNVAENIIQKEIKKETNAKFSVKINNFYATNFLNGEFESLKAKSKIYQHDGIYLKDVEVKTICPYNRVSFENEALYFKENIVINLSAKLGENEVKNTIKSAKLNKKLRSILSEIYRYEAMLPVFNSILPLSLPIKIDENNSAKLKIEKIEIINKEIKFNSYILIPKNK